ncbi:MAG: C40 family peptidase [Clostridiales bacterium]|nr:C40 family peptidase [Clostridiales bacterium]
MNRRIITSLLAGLLVVSVIGSSLVADGNNSGDQNRPGSTQGNEIDPDLNQKLLQFLEDFDETELDPDRNVDTSEHLSDEEILREGYQEEYERYQEQTPKDGWKDQYDTVDPPRTDPTGFFSIGSDIYYTDPVTNVRYCNTTLTYEHIVFTFGSDYKVTSIAAQTGYANTRRVKILLEAFSQIGKPYALYAEPPQTFSCGSFVQYVYLTALGVRQRAGSDRQVQDFENGICAYNNSNLAMTPEYLDYESDMLPGDIIYWYNADCAANHANCPFLNNCDHYKGVHHTAIYIGNGQVIEAAMNNTVSGVIVGDIRQMNGLQIYKYVRLINEDVTLPSVTDLQASPAGKYKVSLTWTGNRYTDGYLIYARKNGVYGYCGITYGTTLINDNYVGSFTDINALSGTNDYYVFPFVTDYGGTMYPGSVSVMVSAAGVCTAVQDLVLTEQLGSIRLDWSVKSDADGYLIYGYHNGAPYGLIAMTSLYLNTNYIDTLASTTQLNRYWVFPFFYESGNVVPGVVSEEVNGYAH